MVVVFHFRSHFWPFKINTHLSIFLKFLTKMAAVGYFVRYSLSIAFLAILVQYEFNFSLNFLQNGCRWPFSLSITFLAISDHYKTFVFTQWPPAPILDVGNSHLIAFLAISDRYAQFWQNGCVGHFGRPKYTFDGISGHFRSIQNRRRSFWMSEIHFRSHFWSFKIDMQLFCCWHFWHNGSRRLFWMSEIHFRSHFWPFQIDMQLYFVLKFLT